MLLGTFVLKNVGQKPSPISAWLWEITVAHHLHDGLARSAYAFFHLSGCKPLPFDAYQQVHDVFKGADFLA